MENHANMGKLALGIAMQAIGLVLTLVIWLVLLKVEVIDINRKRQAATYIIPLLAFVPGLIAYIIYFFNKKAKGQATQGLSRDLFTFGGFLAIAVGLDALVGLAGLLFNPLEIMNALICLVIAVVMQLGFGLIAFSMGNPYK